MERSGDRAHLVPGLILTAYSAWRRQSGGESQFGPDAARATITCRTAPGPATLRRCTRQLACAKIARLRIRRVTRILPAGSLPLCPVTVTFAESRHSLDAESRHSLDVQFDAGRMLPCRKRTGGVPDRATGVAALDPGLAKGVGDLCRCRVQSAGIGGQCARGSTSWLVESPRHLALAADCAARLRLAVRPGDPCRVLRSPDCA